MQTTKTRRFYLSLPGIIITCVALLLALSTLFARDSLAASPAKPAMQAGDGETFALPFAWQGPQEIALGELADVAPPFRLTAATGDFRIQQTTGPDGDGLRILPQPNESGEVGALNIEWRLSDPTNGIALADNDTLIFSLEARTYSPPDGVRFAISDDGGSSSVSAADIGWQSYTVSRVADPTAAKTAIEIAWEPPFEEAWLEIRNMQLEVISDQALMAEPVSATDTPTPVAYPTATWTPFVVTATPEPADLFAAATAVVAATEQAEQLGTATPTAVNMVLATPTPSPQIVTNTPTPANEATLTFNSLRATAIAITTGTPDPRRVLVAATNTPRPPTATPKPTKKPAATKTPTPLFIFVDQMTPTPEAAATPAFPEIFIGKILFLSDRDGGRRPNAYIMNADGSGLARLSSRYFYDRAQEREAYSSDGRYRAFALREEDFGKGGRIQIFYEDGFYGSVRQTTFFGAGVAWSPVWSPNTDHIAFVSSESGNDEIWLVEKDQWPAIKLTENEWQWDLHPSWSPDSKQIIFTSNRTGSRQIWIMDADGGNQQQLTNFPFDVWDPIWVKYPDS
jgi:hypothetical protein